MGAERLKSPVTSLRGSDWRFIEHIASPRGSGEAMYDEIRNGGMSFRGRSPTAWVTAPCYDRAEVRWRRLRQSAIMAINSLLVGFPLILDTV